MKKRTENILTTVWLCDDTSVISNFLLSDPDAIWKPSSVKLIQFLFQIPNYEIGLEKQPHLYVPL